MPGSTVGTSMQYGYAGNYSRTPENITRPVQVSSTSNPIFFGFPVAITGSTDVVSDCSTVAITAANFYGVAVAEVKANLGYTSSGTITTNGGYYANQIADILIAGVVSVQCVYGTPTTGGTVYVRTVLNTGTYPNEILGDFRASADSSNTVALTNVCWANNKIDANNIAEIRIKWPNN